MTRPQRLGGLARATGRGFAVTFLFDVLTQILVLVQGLLVPRLLGPETIGLYGIAIAVVAVGLNVKQIGVSEKLVQEQEVALPRAYSAAFTLEVGLATALLLVALSISPLVAAWYDEPELIAVIAVLGVTIYTTAFLELPGALHLRALNYARQNLLAAVRPVVAFAVTVPLAFAGAGVWSLVFGALAAFLASVAVVAWGAPLRPRIRLDRRVLRRYFAYGWPLWVANLLSLSTTWGGTFVISATAGVAALGFFSVAQSLSQRAFKLDSVLGRAIFPALCRTQDDLEGQRRAFIATNRVTVLWAGPLGFGLFVFAPDLVRLVLGEAWEPGIFLFQMQGLAVTIGSIGYSWDVFFRARGETRPTLTFSLVSEGWVFFLLLPAVWLWGLTGAGWAIAAFGVLSVLTRQIILRRLFGHINLTANAWRELLATGLAAGVAAGIRELTGPPTDLFGFAVLLGLFALVTLAFVAVVDGRFIMGLVSRLRASGGLVAADVSSRENYALVGVEPTPALRTDADVGADDPSMPREALPLGVVSEVAGPGSFPLFAAMGPEGQLWVTFRDSSEVGLLDPEPETWRKWSAPLYPNRGLTDSDGRLWFAATIASALVVVDPSTGDLDQIRLPRSKELLGVGWAQGTGRVLVVDARRRRIVEVDPERAEVVAETPLADAGRPAFVAVEADGSLLVTDTARDRLVRVRPDGSCEAVEVGGPTRSVVIDYPGGRAWVGSARDPVLHSFSLAAPTEVGEVELPDRPFDVCFGPGGVVVASLPASDAVAVVDGGDVTTLPLPAGSEPMGLASSPEGVWVCCAGRDSVVQLA